MNEIYDLEEELGKLEETLKYIKNIRELWKEESKYSDVPQYLEDLDGLESEAKHDYEYYTKELKQKEHEYYNSDEYREAEYWDMQIDLARGK